MAPREMRSVGVDVVVLVQEDVCVNCHCSKCDFAKAKANATRRCDAPRCDDAHLETWSTCCSQN